MDDPDGGEDWGGLHEKGVRLLIAFKRLRNKLALQFDEKTPPPTLLPSNPRSIICLTIGLNWLIDFLELLLILFSVN